jgi:hypothetical protein
MPSPDPPRLIPLAKGEQVGPVCRPATLAETVDHLIARGVVLQGEVAIAVAGTELVRLDLSAVLRAVVQPPRGVPHAERDLP